MIRLCYSSHSLASQGPRAKSARQGVLGHSLLHHHYALPYTKLSSHFQDFCERRTERRAAGLLTILSCALYFSERVSTFLRVGHLRLPEVPFVIRENVCGQQCIGCGMRNHGFPYSTPSNEASSGTNRTACTSTRTRLCSLRPSVLAAKSRNGGLQRNSLRLLATPMTHPGFRPGAVRAFSHVIGPPASRAATKRSQCSRPSPAQSPDPAISHP